MDYRELTEDEIGRLMKNHTTLDGKTVDYCYKLMEQAKEDMGMEEILECVKYMNVLEDRMKINKEKMIMRRTMISESDPLSRFIGGEMGGLQTTTTSLEKQLNKLQLQVDKMMGTKPSPLRRQLTSSKCRS